MRRTGDMADAVTAANLDNARNGTADHFAFKRATGEDMLASIVYTQKAYEEPARWREMRFRVMQRETSWANSARRCLAPYEDLVGRPASRRRADRHRANAR